MIEEKIIIVENLENPQRLDKYLKENVFKDVSRQEIVSLIKEGKILVNHQRIKPAKRLFGGETIQLIDFSVKREEKDIIFPLELIPKIVYENQDFLIIDKPSGLVVYSPNQKYQGPSLLSFLLDKYPLLKEIGEDKNRPAIVHRLDKETSGLMIIPKSNPAYFYFKNLFQERKIEKRYLVLVKGKIPKKEGIINFPIGWSKTQRLKKKAVLNSSQKGKSKEAETYFRVLTYYDGATLIEAIPKTGRTHQIRVHLAAIGFPVIGDKIYGGKKKDLKLKPPRLFLHAHQLKFRGPDNINYEFESPLPEDLKKILEELKNKEESIK